MTSEQLKLLVETTQQVSLARSLDGIMAIVRNSARKLTGADGATFVLKDNGFCYYADEDAISPLWKGQRFPLHTCISGWAMINQQPAVIEDIYKDDRIPIEAYKPTFVKSLVMVPIRTVSPIGAIGNYWADYHTPTPEEVELLQSLADITSVSIENVYVYNELEERVKQRTAQLELANKDLEAFSYSVSHDLRGPLRSISGFSQVLLEEYGDKLDETGHRFINTIVNGTQQMADLIDDLLAFSKLGPKKVSLEKVDMKRLTDAVVSDLQRSANPDTVIITGDLHTVYADGGLMRQVMYNLVSNAVKYSSKKSAPLVEISSEQMDDDVVFTVKDNGAGFDMKYIDKLFGVFQRLHSQQEFRGTGVGLSLVKRIIEKHEGRIWADSVLDEGATFRFALKHQETTAPVKAEAMMAG